MEKKLDNIISHIIDIKTEQARQGVQIDRNTEDLALHIEGVRQNRVRIECIEKIGERKKGAIKFITIACTVAAALVGIAATIVKII